jgi:hypothetical protein
MRWGKDARYLAGGFWKCRVKDHERHRSPEYRCRNLERWHQPGGGYVQRRRRHLAVQREAVTLALAELEQEAAILAVPGHP